MNRSRKQLLIILAAIVAILITLSIIARQKGWVHNNPVHKVTTTTVRRMTIIEKVTASGKIFPITEIKISPQVSGEIIDIYFEEGDTVKKGDLILRINPNIYQSLLLQAEATLNQAKANLANAKARLSQIAAQYENAKLTYERNKYLYEKQAISQAEYDNATAAFKTSQGEYEAAQQTVEGALYSIKSAEASLIQAKDNLAFTAVHAPIDGIISALLVKKGERVVGTAQMAGTEMLRIADFHEMEVRVDVSENDILRISLHDTADVEVDAFLDRKFKGVVTQIANSATTSPANTLSLNTDQVTNFMVKIRLLKESYADLLTTAATPSPFKPGMSASVEIYTDKADNTLAVPIQCVTLRDNDTSTRKNELVFRLNGNKANAVKVKTGIQDDRYIQITSGLNEGDEVVSGPYRVISKLLKDGDLVEKISEEELLKQERKKTDE